MAPTPSPHGPCHPPSPTLLYRNTAMQFIFNIKFLFSNLIFIYSHFLLTDSSTKTQNEDDKLSACSIYPLTIHSYPFKKIKHQFSPHFYLPFTTWFNIPLLIKQLFSVPILRQYHHFNFAQSLRLCNVSKPMSPLTALLLILQEHPRIHLATPYIMYSKEPA